MHNRYKTTNFPAQSFNLFFVSQPYFASAVSVFIIIFSQSTLEFSRGFGTARCAIYLLSNWTNCDVFLALYDNSTPSQNNTANNGCKRGSWEKHSLGQLARSALVNPLLAATTKRPWWGHRECCSHFPLHFKRTLLNKPMHWTSLSEGLRGQRRPIKTRAFWAP